MARTQAAGPLATVAGHGLRITLPARWEARLYLRDRPPETAVEPEDDDAGTAVGITGGLGSGVHPAAYGWAGESPNPVLHLANFALPPGRGDFGTGAVEVMGAEHAFVSLLEYDAEEAGRPLFEHRGVPRPVLRDFAPNQLQRRLAGQLGRQTFFTHEGRPFCLYVVLGSREHAADLVADVHGVLDNLEVSARDDVDATV
ncbi:hypothetical protein SAMN05443575_1587 [Jatrophihabitans endophyticus]|uniref:Uncharacterized protein n=1 Tax=Jatrophihabitans endophyticus TaxID=1206085 RepID=A0A1M5HP60_9ACTN|nr:hypothetical protein [Jatrophihabitans endophyticus]SHG17725.1 hypothetical protein SAMN05443575_1587 [Jatrophihabitans endophyticus]